MATATAKKPRTSIEAVPQLANLPERVSVLETKVENINEKMDDLKIDVKDMHDCLDQTRDRVMAELDKMQNEYRTNATKYFDHADKLHAEDVQSHGVLSAKIKDLEKSRDKLMMYGLIIMAFAAGAGWFDKLDMHTLIKFVGL